MLTLSGSSSNALNEYIVGQFGAAGRMAHGIGGIWKFRRRPAKSRIESFKAMDPLLKYNRNYPDTLTRRLGRLERKISSSAAWPAPATLQMVVSEPDNLSLRENYADTLRDREPKKAEFIHWQIKAERLRAERRNPERIEAVLAGDQILRLHYSEFRPLWDTGDNNYVREYSFNRGLVELVEISARYFLDTTSTKIFEVAPILHLDLSDTSGNWDRLGVDNRLKNIRSLSFSRSGITDADLQALSGWNALKDLWWLDLSHNHIGTSGVASLAKTFQEIFPNLLYVNLAGNLCDPTEEFSADGNLIMDSWLPKHGQMLEAQYGRRIPWLHLLDDRLFDFPPDRFAMPAFLVRKPD
jgi:hypothetical protein